MWCEYHSHEALHMLACLRKSVLRKSVSHVKVMPACCCRCSEAGSVPVADREGSAGACD